jgi:hypothetical protein
VQLEKSNGTLLATVETTGANNGFRAVHFDSFATAVIDTGDQQGQAAPFEVSIRPARSRPRSSSRSGVPPAL